MATLNGNLGGFKDKKMNYGAGKLISAEHLLLIHGGDCGLVCSHMHMHQFRYFTLPTFTICVTMISLSLGLVEISFSEASNYQMHKGAALLSTPLFFFI